MDLRTIADLIISVILLGALGAGSRGLWVYGRNHDEAIADLKTAHGRDLVARDEATADLKAAHEREIVNIKEAHERQLIIKDQVIADLRHRVEAGDVTATRLIEMTFRSVLAGEKAADTAVTALRGKA